MTYDDAFLQDVLDRPDDDTPRSIYADWLEDHGELDHAEFIRLQLRLFGAGGFGVVEANEMEARIEQLRRQHDTEWAGPVVADLATGWSFQRGFVESITVEAETFRDHAGELFAAAPIHRLALAGIRPLLPDVLSNPLLLRLSALDLSANVIGDKGLRLVAQSRFLAPLTALSLRNNSITADGLLCLAASPYLKRLRWLDLSWNNFGRPGLAVLKDGRLRGQLIHIELESALGGPYSPQHHIP